MAEKESPVTVEMTEEPKENEEKPAKPKIKNVSVLIGERTVPLRLTTPGIIQIEEDLDMDIEELRETMNNLKKKNTRLMIKTLRILGNEGLRLKGEAPDLTDEELMDKIPAHNLLLYRVVVLAAIALLAFGTGTAAATPAKSKTTAAAPAAAPWVRSSRPAWIGSKRS